MWFSL